jgi:hypothetical protein
VFVSVFGFVDVSVARTPIGRYLIGGFVEVDAFLIAECIASVFEALTFRICAETSRLQSPTCS